MSGTMTDTQDMTTTVIFLTAAVVLVALVLARVLEGDPKLARAYVDHDLRAFGTGACPDCGGNCDAWLELFGGVA